MDPATLSMIATLASGLFGGLMGGKGQSLTREQRALLDAQRRGSDIENALNRLKLSRMQSQDPLFRALQMQAFSRLPVFAKQGIDISNFMRQPIGVGIMPDYATEVYGSRPRGNNPPSGRAVPK